MMETQSFFSASGFAPEANFSGIPRTPPYTPARAKRRLERSDSPASSNAGSIHPLETSSPNKKVLKRIDTDGITVEELVEGDIGYLTDIDVVYPQELEEIGSDSDDDDNDDDDDNAGHDDKPDTNGNDAATPPAATTTTHDSDDDSSSSLSDAEAATLSLDMSRMRCEDGTKQDFEEHRRRMRQHKRTDSRIFKRSHSQSIKSEVEATDIEGKDDHDLKSSWRRLRRRVQGPQSTRGPLLDDLARISPEAGHLSAGSTDSQAGRRGKATAEPQGMDLDVET